MYIMASLVETIPSMALMWVAHMLTAWPAVILWIVARRRVTWHKWEYSLVAVPYVLWAAAFMVTYTGFGAQKGPASLLESFAVGAAVSAATVWRVCVGGQSLWLARSFYLGCCVTAVAIGLACPGDLILP